MKYTSIAFAAFIVLILFVIPSVAAITSIITVQTKSPLHGVIIRVKSPPSQEIIDSVYGYTDASGKAVMNYTTSLTRAAFTINVVKEGIVKDTKEIDNVTLTSQLEYSFFNEPTTPPVTAPTSTATNVTPVTTTTTSTQPATETGTITGKVTGSEGSYPALMWYILVGTLLLGIAGFFVTRYVRTTKSVSPGPRPPTRNEILKSQKTAPSPTMEASLRQAQIKVKQAQEELDKITRVREAEQRMQDAARELERAKKGF